MRPPAITPGHERLLALVGDWVGEERVTASRWLEGGEARGYVIARPDLGGYYVLQDYRQERDGATAFEARGVFGYDTEDHLYKLYWFDSLGFAPPAPASGAWKDDTLILVRASLRGAARHVYTFDGPDRYRLRIEYSWGGGDDWAEVLSGDYRRQS